MIIGRDAKDVSEEEAPDYIAAYTVGNDISSRKLQINKAIAGPVPQWGFSKGFDTFAPMGPCLVRADLIGNPSRLRLETLIDGELRQDVLVSDLIFDCAALVSYLSTGTTLQKGSVIMTGTPGGKLAPIHKLVPFSQKHHLKKKVGVGNGLTPPQFLQAGTQMEVKVTDIGTLRNGVKFL